YLNLRDLNLLHYNLPLYKNEKTNRDFMRKVVKTFLRYLDKNKSNAKLALFVKEFFLHYYSKNKDEYKKLYSL
ncbi:hypothetical protein PVBG_03681, partial [Plasmodium vivax Brazil I]